jgi:hypothetical protein
MRTFVLFVVGLLASVANAQSIRVSGDYRVTKEMSPFKFSSISIMAGRLIVDPGVVLEPTTTSARIMLSMQSASAIEVNGTAEDPVVIAPSEGVAYWSGIRNTERLSSRPSIKLHNVLFLGSSIDVGSVDADLQSVQVVCPRLIGSTSTRGISFRNNSIGSVIDCVVDGATVGFGLSNSAMVFQNCRAVNCFAAINGGDDVLFNALSQ